MVARALFCGSRRGVKAALFFDAIVGGLLICFLIASRPIDRPGVVAERAHQVMQDFFQVVAVIDRREGRRWLAGQYRRLILIERQPRSAPRKLRRDDRLCCLGRGVRRVRRIVAQAPMPLRQLKRAVPRDLETIVVKAMAAAPRARPTK